PFSGEAVFKLGKAGDAAAGPRHAFDKARSDRIDDLRKHYRGGRGRLQHRPEYDVAGHEDSVRRERGELRRKFPGTGSVERGPTVLDANVAPHGPARGLQRLLERRTAGNRFRIILGENNEDAHAPHPLGLLPAPRQRPHRRRAAKQREDLAAPHVEHRGVLQPPRVAIVQTAIAIALAAVMVVTGWSISPASAGDG